jgi:hypothetical protein
MNLDIHNMVAGTCNNFYEQLTHRRGGLVRGWPRVGPGWDTRQSGASRQPCYSPANPSQIPAQSAHFLFNRWVGNIIKIRI